MQTHNYFFLQAFVAELSLLLEGEKIIRCYSSHSDTIIFEFSNAQTLHLEMCGSELFFALLPLKNNAPKQFTPRFTALNNQKISKIEGITCDRILVISLANGQQLVFCFFGRKSNVLLYLKDNQPSEIWRAQIQSDKNKKLEELLAGPRFTDFPVETRKLSFIPIEILPFFPEELKSVDQLHEILPFINLKLKWDFDPKNPQNGIYIPSDDSAKKGVLEILKHYFETRLPKERNQERKQQLLKKYTAALFKAQKAKEACENRLYVLENQRSQKEIADLILTYSHLFEPRHTEITLVDYYQNNQTITIQLPKDTSAVAYAAKLYKKHKGVSDEKKVVREKIVRLSSEIKRISDAIIELEKQESNKELIQIEKKERSHHQQIDQQKQLPFHEIELDGFIIRIGKSAEANDEMLRNHTQKNDIWLHAKDHAGSHVIIKTTGQSQGISEKVLQSAANWAAYYSKGKNHSLLPVIYTERKYVRKNKRLRAGQVIVDKERVIMAKPEKPPLPTHF